MLRKIGDFGPKWWNLVKWEPFLPPGMGNPSPGMDFPCPGPGSPWPGPLGPPGGGFGMPKAHISPESTHFGGIR